MGPKEWTAALAAGLANVPLRRRPEVRAVRVTPGGYRVILHHHELTHRILMQVILERSDINRVLASWEAANGPLALCFTFGGDDIDEAEEMITIDNQGVKSLDPIRSKQRVDELTDEGPEAWYKQATGAALPFSLPRGMHRCHVTTWETPGASDAFGGLPVLPVVLAKPVDLTILGYFGHGANSYSIYYISSEGDHYAFIRLHFGGAYSSIDQDRRYVTAYLRGYARWRERTRPRLRRSTLIHNVGSTSLRVGRKDAPPGEDLIEIPCSSWKEADEGLEALLQARSAGE